ncbi:chromate transporter [Propylenella binzhouense]|uniref:Chromate transporter n=1 Tax=Propylenella binzhouense TaxID=2555902 RepID=A0A964T5L4_9HYPH|nr:chromate transporter [Propylenella binzhouense]MYZ48898.1 chromate transporter [Propylenella binzhouense]
MSSRSDVLDSRSSDRPSLMQIALGFGGIAIVGFGGVLPWARRMLVEQRRWMTPSQFSEDLALSQFLPGPNIVNLSIVVGQRFHGLPGAAAAAIGLLGPPMLIVILLASIYGYWNEIAAVHDAMRGVASAAAGLILATAAKMAVPLFRADARLQLAFAIITFLGVAVLGASLPVVLLAIAPVSVAFAWWRVR